MNFPYWSKLENPFDNVTRNNYSLGYEIVRRMYGKLIADPNANVKAIGELLEQDAKNYMEHFEFVYGQKLSEPATDARKKREALGLVQANMQSWEKELFVVLKAGNQLDIHERLFPKGRIGLYTRGSQEERLNNFIYFAKTVSQIALPDAASVKAEVMDVLTRLKESDADVIDGDREMDVNLANLEMYRKAVAIAMYRALGSLMFEFPARPDLIEAYIPVDLMTRSQQVEFTSSRMAPANTTLLFARTYEDDEELKVRNLGVTELQVYRAERNGSAPGAVSVVVPPAGEVVVKMQDLGVGRFYFIRNLDVEREGAYVVTVL